MYWFEQRNMASDGLGVDRNRLSWRSAATVSGTDRKTPFFTVTVYHYSDCCESYGMTIFSNRAASLPGLAYSELHITTTPRFCSGHSAIPSKPIFGAKSPRSANWRNESLPPGQGVDFTSASGCRGPVRWGTRTALGVVALRQRRPWPEARRRRGRRSRATA